MSSPNQEATSGASATHPTHASIAMKNNERPSSANPTRSANRHAIRHARSTCSIG